MGWKDKIRLWLKHIILVLQGYIDSKKQQLHRGIEVTEQMKAEKLRKKHQRHNDMPDGTRKTMVTGIMMKKKFWEVMQDEWSRRRNIKKGKK